MGFYGNVTNTAKTTFSFDLIYTTRSDMDSNANTDGVFLGRYVLVNYDEEPIKAYYNIDDGAFYSTGAYAAHTKITPRENLVYQDLGYNPNRQYRFYVWDTVNKRYKGVTENTPYAKYFSIDVTEYGRGYDSTVWVKRYDTATNAYKYVMVAELNAVVPTLHLVVDEPSAVPVTPYFDRDTTNIDYYLHMQSDYGMQIKEADLETYSDEKIERTPVYWELDSNGHPIIQKGEKKDINADIFFNKKGFDHNIRTYISGERGKNTINYKMASSGRRYGGDADQGVYEEGVLADDVYEWYIRLAGIGNAISGMWDKVYGYNNINQKRFLNKALRREDSIDHRTTYDKTTLMGMINTCQDLFGYHFVPFNSTHKIGSNITSASTEITVSLTYEVDNITDSVKYKVLDCLFYDPSTTNNQYYYYAYNPTYEAITGTPKAGETYYYKDSNDIFHLANIANYQAKDANGNNIEPLYQTYYTRSNRWTMTALKIEQEDTIYGMLVELHKLLGTNSNEVRNIDSVRGSINIIKDIIDRIDLNLTPGRLLHTNNQGIIETTDAYYPSKDSDANRVLVGNPTLTADKAVWENRIRSVEIQEGSTSTTSFVANEGLIDSNVNNNNKISYKAGNKWINLEVMPTSQLITIRHAKSNQAEHNFMNDITINKNIDGSATSTTDCQFEFPMVETDNAGHIIGYSKKSIYIPYNYRNFTLAAQSNAETAITTNNGTQEADTTTDTFTFATGNQWVEARVDEDKFTFAHALINEDATKKWEFKSTSTTGWQSAKDDGNKLTIPTFEIDNAGHIVRNSSVDFYIPHNFRNIAVTTDNDADVDSVQTNGTISADSTIDTWTIAPQNKWIDITADSTNDKITIGHKYSALKAWEFTPTATAGMKATDNGNSFTIPTFTTDNAGHIISSSSITYYVPHTFKTINIAAQSTGLTQIEPSAAAQNLVADSITDTFTIATGNKWIQTTSDATNDKVTFSHLVQSIATTEPTSNLNNEGTFKTEEYTYDEAGHIRSKGTRTLTLPYGYKTLKVGAVSTAITAITPAAGSVIAQNQVDSMTFISGNKWIQMVTNDSANKDADTITIAHSLQGTAGKYTGTDLAFTEFGGVVTIYGYETDNAGHIISNPTYTLTLPIGSYNNSASSNSSNVITGIGFTPKTGAITSTSQTLGSLLLTGYTATEYDTATITATDSLNAAIAKLEKQVSDEANAREEAVLAESTARANAITGLRMFKTINVGGTVLEADSNADTLSISAANDGIVLNAIANTDSFTIGHKTGHQITSGFYKFSTDAYGHISATTAITLEDLTGLGAATAANLTAHINNKENPHSVTKAQVGLGNVANESKATMFTSAALTGTPTAPTAAVNTNTTQIATTAFVTRAISNESSTRETAITNAIAAQWISKYNSFDDLYQAIVQQLIADGYIEEAPTTA